MPLCANSRSFAVEKESKSIYSLLKIIIMKTKKSNRLLKIKYISDEIFIVISACACVLTDCQDYSIDAVNLANNLWKIYHQFGGHDRYWSLHPDSVSFESLLKSKCL